MMRHILCGLAAGAFFVANISDGAQAADGATYLRPSQTPSIVRLAQSSGGGYLPPDQGQYERGQSEREPPRQIAPRRDDYSAPPPQSGYGSDRGYNGSSSPYDRGPPPPAAYREDSGYSSDEIMDAGHRFFGAVSKNLAKVVEYAFSKQGRPNGYILGEEAGGALIAGLRYGEGRLFTKFDGEHKVFWQGPSIGYDVGGEGSKTLILVYNLTYADELFQRYAGVDGSAYLVGGIGLTFQKQGDVILAPIRSGVGVRFGANVGYLKYTRNPTWNPF